MFGLETAIWQHDYKGQWVHINPVELNLVLHMLATSGDCEALQKRFG